MAERTDGRLWTVKNDEMPLLDAEIRKLIEDLASVFGAPLDEWTVEEVRIQKPEASDG